MSNARSDFSVTVDGRMVPVSVLRHPRSRRLRLRYDAPQGHLRLTMPPRSDLNAAVRWVGEQQVWIRRQLARDTGCQPVGPGTRLPYGDDELWIDWRTDAPRRPILVDDRLLLGGPVEAVGRRVARWLADQGRREWAAATAALAAGAGLALNGVSVGDPRSRWGSCSSTKYIRYSWRLMLAPKFVQQSVIAHEVAHLGHLDHSPRFHALAAALLGEDPARARAWLRQHGAALHRWDFS